MPPRFLPGEFLLIRFSIPLIVAQREAAGYVSRNFPLAGRSFTFGLTVKY
jgi:hypothetical protein